MLSLSPYIRPRMERQVFTLIRLNSPIAQMTDNPKLPAFSECVKNYQDTVLDTDNFINLDFGHLVL